MLFCYNLIKTYREVAGDIIQILIIVVYTKLNGKEEAIGKIAREKKIEFKKIDDFLRLGVDNGFAEADEPYKMEDYKLFKKGEDDKTKTPYELTDANIPLSPINLNDGLYFINQLLMIFNSYTQLLEEKRTGGIKCIKFLFDRISKKLNLDLKEGPVNLTDLRELMNIFKSRVEFVFDTPYLKDIEGNISREASVGRNSTSVNRSSSEKSTENTRSNRHPTQNNTKKKGDRSHLKRGAFLGIYKDPLKR
jgi:hypothetical protein